MARILHPGVTRFFAATGTTLEEQAFAALPASRVPERLTTADELAQRELLNQRDRRPSMAPLRGYTIDAQGSERHKQFGVTFHFVDGTEQRFAPHTN